MTGHKLLRRRRPRAGSRAGRGGSRAGLAAGAAVRHLERGSRPRASGRSRASAPPGGRGSPRRRPRRAGRAPAGSSSQSAYGQQRMAGAAGAVGVERARRRRRRRAPPSRELRPRRGRRAARGRARGTAPASVREVAREPVQDDRGAALDDRERVAPEPEREPERDGRDGDRVQPLARRGGGASRACRSRSRRAARSSRVERRAIPRRSASACATDGGPANAATAVSSRPRPCSSRRRSPRGRSEKRRSGERARCSSAASSYG